jgi:hypothetical protein
MTFVRTSVFVFAAVPTFEFGSSGLHFSKTMKMMMMVMMMMMREGGRERERKCDKRGALAK